jgi:hypothetical protein
MDVQSVPEMADDALGAGEKSGYLFAATVYHISSHLQDSITTGAIMY